MEVKKLLRIGLVRRGWSPTGGAEAYLLRLAEELSRRNHAITLYASTWPAEEWPYGAMVRLAGSSPTEFAQAFAAHPKAYPDEIFFSMERVPGCQVFRAGDGVHAAWLERRKLFESCWKSWFRGWNRKHHEFLRLEKQVFDPTKTGWIIANSHFVAKEIASFYSYPAERITVIPNGYTAPLISSSLETRNAIRATWNIPKEAFVALFVGSGWERKGLSVAIEGVARLPNTVLLVAGRGNERKYSAPWVRHLGPQRSLTDFFGAADVLLQPTWYDPFSNACLEGLAAGLPVITTRDNGFSEILQEGLTGTVISRADAIEEIVKSLQFWRDSKHPEQTNRCKSAAAEFTPERNAEQTIAILHQIKESSWKPVL